MKHILIFCALSVGLFAVLSSNAQTKKQPSTSTNTPEVVSVPASKQLRWRTDPRDWNSAEWQADEVITNKTTGEIVEIIPHRYTELGDGLHYLDTAGHWQPSEEVIEPTDSGAAAVRGPTKVYFANNINSEASVTILTRSNNVLRLRPVGLFWFSAETGESVPIALMRDSQGEIAPPNSVIYPSVLDQVRANLRYVWRRGSFECFLELLEAPPLPPEAMRNSSLRLEFWHLLDADERQLRRFPVVLQSETNAVKRASMAEPDVVEELVHVGGDGELLFPQGYAFSLGDIESAGTQSGAHGEGAVETDSQRVRVAKRLVRMGERGERLGLVESVPWEQIRDQLQKLPQPARGASMRPSGAQPTKGRPLPAFETVAAPARPMLVASAPYEPRGFCIDYVTVSSGGSYTFAAHTTHYLNSAVTFNGTVGINSGAVLKFAAGATLTINNPGYLYCNTSGSPAVFTSKDENIYGETILGSTGNPSSVGSTMLTINDTPSNITFANLRFRWAQRAIHLFSAYRTFVLADSSINYCVEGVHVYYCNFTFQNSTKCGVTTPLINNGSSVSGSLTEFCETTLGAAVEKPGWAFSTGGNANWYHQTSTTHDGSDAAQSGDINDYESTYMEATVSGPGTVSFWWKVSSEGGWDYLRFYIDGVEQPGKISGEQDWAQVSFAVSSGGHTLRWAYTKDSSLSYGADAGWVDQVEFSETIVPPTITTQPQSQTVAQGLAANFSVVATGSSPLSYQWAFNGTAISGATSSTYTIASVQPSHAGTYTVTVTNIAGSVVSSGAVLTVSTGGGSTALPAGCVAWWKAENNTNDTVGTSHGVLYNGAGYTSGMVGSAFNLSGSQHVRIPDNAATRVTSGATFEGWVYPTSSGSQMTIVAKWDAVVNVDERSYVLVIEWDRSIGFGVSPYGTDSQCQGVNSGTSHTVPLNQWSHVACTYDGSSLILYLNGQNVGQVSYSLGIHPGDITYAVGGVVGGYDSGDTRALSPFQGRLDEVTIYNRALPEGDIQAIYNAGAAGKYAPSPPTITTQPQSQTVQLGSNVTFYVVASGTAPLGYQWRFNGVNIAGATASSFTTNNVQLGSAGNYSVQVSNSVGTTISQNAVLTILPYIITQPQSQTVYSGSNVAFSVVANGTPTLSYQWRFNGVNIAGATGSSFTTNNVQPASAGNYSVQVSNSGGSTNSQNAVLTVKDANDPDYDGVPTWLEVEQGTNPNSADSVLPLRLGYWRFPTSTFLGEANVTYSGEPAPVPRSSANVQSVAAWSGNAARVASGSPAVLRYNDIEWDGTANVNCRQGTIRFWFAPTWNSGTGPGATGNLLNVGASWALQVNAQGTYLVFHISSGNLLTGSISWTANSWHHVCLVYSPTATALYVDAALVAIGSGVTQYPDASARSGLGLNLGGDAAGGSQSFGTFDELDTFNYAQSPGEVWSAYQADTDLDGMADWWETKWFGNLSRDGSGNYDGDSLNDLQEFKDGTNPTSVNPASTSIRIFEPKGTAIIP